MKTKLDIVASAAIRKSSWLSRCKVPNYDLIVLQEMYDKARKIEDNLETHWCLSRLTRRLQISKRRWSVLRMLSKHF